MSKINKRQALIDTAVELFSRDGFHATGIDKLLESAGVARMTLYNHFGSKTELIAAALEYRHKVYRDWFQSELADASPEPRKQLLAVFDVLEMWFLGEAPGPPFAGCTFINAAAEFGRKDDPIHHVAASHKNAQRRDLAQIAQAAGARAPEELARNLHLLMEGAIVTEQVMPDSDAAARAKMIARLLIDRAIPEGW